MKPGKRKYKQVTNEQLKVALAECKGIYSAASKWIARELGVSFSRQGIAKRVDASPELRAFVDNLSEETLDWAESLLLNHLKNGNVTALIFYLKTRGKARGYCERQEIVGAGDGAPPAIRVEFVSSNNAKA